MESFPVASPVATGMRRLWPIDRPLLKAHFLRLGRETRHDRFAMGVSDAFLDQYAERCFGFDDVIYGFVQNGTLRGVGELRPLAAAAGARMKVGAEAAFSVERAWQRQGVGGELFRRILRAARNRGLTSLYMMCLSHNEAMRKLGRRYGAEMDYSTDAVTGRLVARAATSRSVMREAVADSTSFVTAMLDLQKRVLTR